ncbi:alpha/beta hydrolase [candidate division KSB1 bacterium]|nr:alpha/beta hydrolase [candidate division KSB1 bacterium]
MDILNRCCAPDVTLDETMVPVKADISLRLIKFTPPAPISNPPVIFVPGWITRIEAWEKVLREMTSDFVVYYVETREKISSQVNRKTPISVQSLGEDLVNLVEALELLPKSYILLGSSLGATAILESCRSLETDPLCIILIGPNASFHIPRAGLVLIKICHPVMYFGIRPVVKWYLKTFRLDSESDYAQYRKYCNALDVADPFKLKKMALSMPSYQVWDFIEDIDYPALLIGASKDLLHDKDVIQSMTSKMNHATYLDMQTNAATHSPGVVYEIRKYLGRFARAGN